jgi:hypothetical protein
MYEQSEIVDRQILKSAQTSDDVPYLEDTTIPSNEYRVPESELHDCAHKAQSIRSSSFEYVYLFAVP